MPRQRASMAANAAPPDSTPPAAAQTCARDAVGQHLGSAPGYQAIRRRRLVHECEFSNEIERLLLLGF